MDENLTEKERTYFINRPHYRKTKEVSVPPEQNRLFLGLVPIIVLNPKNRLNPKRTQGRIRTDPFCTRRRGTMSLRRTVPDLTLLRQYSLIS